MKHNSDACEACRAELRPDNGGRPHDSASFVLQTLAAAALATSLTILGTAGDLGPFAPMLIAMGLYLAVFGGLIYAALAGRVVMRAIARKWGRRAGALAQSRELPERQCRLSRGRA